MAFVGETRITTPYGTRRMDRIERADELWSWDSHGGRLVVSRVRQVRVATVTEIVMIAAGNARVSGVSADHELYVPAEGWRPARTLAVGMLVLGWAGLCAPEPVRIFEYQRVDCEVRVIDIAVAEIETYFAGQLVARAKPPQLSTSRHSVRGEPRPQPIA